MRSLSVLCNQLICTSNFTVKDVIIKDLEVNPGPGTYDNHIKKACLSLLSVVRVEKPCAHSPRLHLRFTTLMFFDLKQYCYQGSGLLRGSGSSRVAEPNESMDLQARVALR